MSDTEQGRDLILGVSVDAGVSFLPIAGIRTKEFTRENPIDDVTSQSDTGLETAAAFTGYGTVTLSGSGKMDKTITTVYEYKDLAAAANSATPELLCQLIDSTGETYEGTFLITSFGKTSEQQGIVEFNIALQNKGEVDFTAGT